MLNTSKQYWIAKQKILEIFKKKKQSEVFDYNVEYSLNNLNKIDDSCSCLIRITDKYCNILQKVTEAEDDFSDFVSSNHPHNVEGVQEKLETVGSQFRQISTQRFGTIIHLKRFSDELKNFKKYALKDTLKSAKIFESTLSKYHGKMCLMTNKASNLNTDNATEMRYFQAIQSNVRSCKGEYDVLYKKLQQKIGMLLSSRLCLIFRYITPYRESIIYSFGKIRDNLLNLEFVLCRSNVSSNFNKSVTGSGNMDTSYDSFLENVDAEDDSDDELLDLEMNEGAIFDLNDMHDSQTEVPVVSECKDEVAESFCQYSQERRYMYEEWLNLLSRNEWEEIKGLDCE